MSQARRRGTVYTFYSYKGGVGRSMALANVAALLSRRGRKVLVVDFDLEAPGLEQFFQRYLDSDRSRATTPGVAELLGWIGAGAGRSWRECVFTARLPFRYGEPISIISAGRLDDGYVGRVRELSFARLFEQHDLGRALEQIRDEWLEAYDAVLVDSRTGITDLGGVCTIHLPDVLLAFFTANHQSIEGTRYVLRRAREEQATLPLNRHRLVTVPILARDQSSAEDDLGREWHDRAASQLAELFADWLPREMRPVDAIRMFKVPNEAKWSFGEGLPVLDDAQLVDSTKIGHAYERIAAFLDSGLRLQDDPRAKAAANESALRRANEVIAATLSRELAAVVDANLEGDPQLNLALLREALERSETEQALAALGRWVSAPGRCVLRGHALAVRTVAFSPDGRRLLTASYDGTARVWDVESGRLLAALVGHADAIWSAAFSPDGLRVVTASGDETARIWNAATGAPLVTLAGHEGLVRSTMFSPDGTLVLTASDDETARVWSAASGRARAVLPAHTEPVREAVFSPDGQYIATASGKNAYVWSLDGGPVAVLPGHSGWIQKVAFSGDGRRVATAGAEGTARVWEVPSGRLLTTLSGHTGVVWWVAFSPDGTRAITASGDGSAQVWNAATGFPVRRLTSHQSWIWSVGFSPDSALVVTAGGDGSVRVSDVSDVSSERSASIAAHRGPVLSAAFSPDSRRIVTAGEDHTARIWDTATGGVLVLSGHQDRVWQATFSPDGNLVATASSDGTARIWEPSTGATIATLTGHSGPVTMAQFSPDSLRVVTAGVDGSARVWDAVTGKLLVALAGHAGPVWTAGFSPDGVRILTGGADGTARIARDFSWASREQRSALLETARALDAEERRQYLHE